MSRLTGSEAQSLMEAYNAVYAPQELTEEQIWEEVESWVNSLLEEGYDLSDYTWEEMYESYLNEMGQRMTTGQATAPKAPPIVQSRPIDRIAGGGMGGRRGSGSNPSVSRPQVSTTQVKPTPTPAAKPQFGTTAPRGASVTSTGVSGLSPADRAAYSAGGGNAAAQRGMGQTTAQVIAQGKANLGRMDQGRPAPARPAAPAPAARPAAPAPAAKPAAPAPAAKPAPAPAAKPVPTPTATTGFKLAQQGVDLSKPSVAPTTTPTPAAAPTPAPKPSALAQRVAGYKAGGPVMGARERMLNQSFDLFDVIKGHLLDEGYADTEESALAIMANMSEQWKQSILEG